MNVTGAVPTPQKCSICDGYFTGPHYCPGHRPPYGFGAFTPWPLTEERVREIVRDELARNAGVPEASKTSDEKR
jgi:hypothetical protein